MGPGIWKLNGTFFGPVDAQANLIEGPNRYLVRSDVHEPRSDSIAPEITFVKFAAFDMRKLIAKAQDLFGGPVFCDTPIASAKGAGA